MQRVGSYEVVRILARGGMAVVYLARQPTLDRDVALKRLQLESNDPSLAVRFVREARLAGGLHHPNLVTLYDFFEHDGVPYIAMEYVGGGSLRRLVGRLALPQVLGVLEGILAGLAHAESRKIVHRDLKPENVLISRDGAVKIADFGIARAYNALTPSLTGSGVAIGTPTYMAPEQVNGDPLGPYTDIYSLGVIAYELLAGRPPFEPEGPPLAVLYSHVHKPPPPLADHAPDAPPELCEWVEWLLAKPPRERPASAAGAWQALEEITVGELGPYWRRTAAVTPDSTPTLVVETEAPAATTPLVPRQRRRGRWLAAAAVVVIAAAAAVALLPSSDPGPEPAPKRAATAKPKAKAAAPYDFNGDGRAELVVSMPNSGRDNAGVVLIARGRRSRLITPKDARISGPYDGHEDFGRSVASGDFNRDGRADLAISVPGLDRVAVIGGAARGEHGGAVRLIRPSEFRLEPGEGRYGKRMLAADMNRDGFDDVVVGAPSSDLGLVGSGIVQILYGGPRGLGVESRPVPRPLESLTGFGTALRAGDVDGDGYMDLVEGGHATANTTGHLCFCQGSRHGPRSCRLVAADSSTSALAVADVNGDDRDDILQGDATANLVRLWLGGRRGPKAEPILIGQGTRSVPGLTEPEDRFGEGVGAADLDGDGRAEMVISAPGENSGDGAITVVRGGRSGYAGGGHSTFTAGQGLPGERGSGYHVDQISVLDIAGNRRPDVILRLRDADRVQDGVLVIVAGKSVFAPGETRIRQPLRGSVAVKDPKIRDIRIARGAGA